MMDDSKITTSKSLGQHWLHDEQVLNSICEAASVSKEDYVLEIGPGLGTLTKVLVDTGAEVKAVEFDARLAGRLLTSVNARNLSVVNQDILKFDLGSLPANYKVVANIPYYLTSVIIRKLSESENPPVACSLLVQKEVAQRAAAKPGQLSILGVSVQYFWEVSLGRVVEAKLFTPPPKVDSQILILNRRKTDRFPEADTELYFKIVKAGFSAKRKTLANSLGKGLQLDKIKTIELLERSNIDPKTRPQQLSLDNWHTIYREYTKIQTA